MSRAKVFENIEMPTFWWHLRSWDEIKSSSLFTKVNWINIAMLVVFVVVAIRQAKSKMKAAEQAGFEKRFLKNEAFPQPAEQPDFDYSNTEPEQLRRFKPKYFLTMSLENLDPNELILMDKTYPERVKYRSQTMREHTTNAVNVNDDKRIRPAVKEYYTYMLGTYLPLRYPKMFKLHETEYETGKTFMLENKVTGALFPASPISNSISTKTLLETLGRTIDEDVLFLLPEENTPEDFDPKYVLQAYVCCCPSGFNPGQKLGLRLASIHEPVPGYKDKLEASMDRYFAKLEVGKYVKRFNWTVTVDTDLYSADHNTNHLHENDKSNITPMSDDEFEGLLEKSYLRCERQTLHRLPKSQAIVFSFHTYRYLLSDVKSEGKGEELADAIDGMKGGMCRGCFFIRGGCLGGGGEEVFEELKRCC